MTRVVQIDLKAYNACNRTVYQPKTNRQAGRTPPQLGGETILIRAPAREIIFIINPIKFIFVLGQMNQQEINKELFKTTLRNLKLQERRLINLVLIQKLKNQTLKTKILTKALPAKKNKTTQTHGMYIFTYTFLLYIQTTSFTGGMCIKQNCLVFGYQCWCSGKFNLEMLLIVVLHFAKSL